MTTPLYICRSCRGIPECHELRNAAGRSWAICCTGCDRRVTSAISYEDARARWNGEGPPPEPPSRARLKFNHNRRSTK